MIFFLFPKAENSRLASSDVKKVVIHEDAASVIPSVLHLLCKIRNLFVQTVNLWIFGVFFKCGIIIYLSDPVTKSA